MVTVLTPEQVSGMTRAALVGRLVNTHGRMQAQMLKFSDAQLKEMLAALEDSETVTVDDIDLSPELDAPEEVRKGRVAADLTALKREEADKIVATLHVDGKPVKKSDTIRALDGTLTFAEIALYMDCKYQMVYNILKYNPQNKLK